MSHIIYTTKMSVKYAKIITKKNGAETKNY
jgi:hypothetical protein